MKLEQEMKLKDEINVLGKVIIKFSATWCAPCKTMGAVLDGMSEKADIKVIDIDIDEFPLIARDYNVMSVPTMLFYNDGEKLTSETGVLPPAAVNKIFAEN